MIRFLSHPPEIVPHEAVLTNLMPSEQEPNDGDRNECCQDGQYNQEPHRISLYDRMNPHGPSTIRTQQKTATNPVLRLPILWTAVAGATVSGLP